MDDVLEPGADEELLDVADDATFAREEAQALYITGFMDVNPARWLRMREQVRFEDVMFRLTGFTRSVISCPFHGRDSTPSFHVYRRGNDAFCFGCPPGKQYYDAIIFASEKLGVSRLAALRWLEKEYNLPELPDVEPDRDEDNEQPFTLTFRDVLPAYVEHATKHIQQAQDIELAQEYLEILFDAWPTRTEEKANPNAGDVLPLARVVGKTVVDYLLEKKAR